MLRDSLGVIFTAHSYWSLRKHLGVSKESLETLPQLSDVSVVNSSKMIGFESTCYLHLLTKSSFNTSSIIVSRVTNCNSCHGNYNIQRELPNSIALEMFSICDGHFLATRFVCCYIAMGMMVIQHLLPLQIKNGSG